VTPFAEAVMMTEVVFVTRAVLMRNAAEVMPIGTLVVAGTFALELLLESETVTLLVAGPLRFTVPVGETPPVTEVALMVTEVSDCADAGGQTANPISASRRETIVFRDERFMEFSHFLLPVAERWAGFAPARVESMSAF
jgi:hypothetical protein